MMAFKHNHLIEKKVVRPCSICGRPMSDPVSLKLGFGPSHLYSKNARIIARVDAHLKRKGMTRVEAHQIAGGKGARGGKGQTGHLDRPKTLARKKPAAAPAAEEIKEVNGKFYRKAVAGDSTHVGDRMEVRVGENWIPAEVIAADRKRFSVRAFDGREYHYDNADRKAKTRNHWVITDDEGGIRSGDKPKALRRRAADSEGQHQPGQAGRDAAAGRPAPLDGRGRKRGPSVGRERAAERDKKASGPRRPVVQPKNSAEERLKAALGGMRADREAIEARKVNVVDMLDGSAQGIYDDDNNLFPHVPDDLKKDVMARFTGDEAVFALAVLNLDIAELKFKEGEIGDGDYLIASHNFDAALQVVDSRSPGVPDRVASDPALNDLMKKYQDARKGVPGDRIINPALRPNQKKKVRDMIALIDVDEVAMDKLVTIGTGPDGLIDFDKVVDAEHYAAGIALLRHSVHHPEAYGSDLPLMGGDEDTLRWEAAARRLSTDERLKIEALVDDHLIQSPARGLAPVPPASVVRPSEPLSRRRLVIDFDPQFEDADAVEAFLANPDFVGQRGGKVTIIAQSPFMGGKAHVAYRKLVDGLRDNGFDVEIEDGIDFQRGKAIIDGMEGDIGDGVGGAVFAFRPQGGTIAITHRPDVVANWARRGQWKGQTREGYVIFPGWRGDMADQDLMAAVIDEDVIQWDPSRFGETDLPMPADDEVMRVKALAAERVASDKAMRKEHIRALRMAIVNNESLDDSLEAAPEVWVEAFIRNPPKKYSTTKSQYGTIKHHVPAADVSEAMGHGMKKSDAETMYARIADGLYVIRNDKAGINRGEGSDVVGNYWIVDYRLGTERRYMVKSGGGQAYGGWERDIEAELAAGVVVDVLGIQAAKPQRGEVLGEDNYDWMVVKSAFDEYGLVPNTTLVTRDLGTSGPDGMFRFAEALRKGKHPDGALEIALFDFLIDNRADRHWGNWLIGDDGNGGAELIAIDHGLAFGAAGHLGPYVPDPYAEFDGWMRGYRASEGLAVLAANVHRDGVDGDIDREALAAAVDKMIDDWKVEMAQLLALEEIMAEKHGMTDRELWVESVVLRLEYLDEHRAEVVDWLMQNAADARRRGRG